MISPTLAIVGTGPTGVIVTTELPATDSTERVDCPIAEDAVAHSMYDTSICVVSFHVALRTPLAPQREPWARSSPLGFPMFPVVEGDIATSDNCASPHVATGFIPAVPDFQQR
jgi:hypothetical protein|tara:strand:+ start:9488 stop:9826 length:339 start_codon:yes stop_codon:yes gene_type:complete